MRVISLAIGVMLIALALISTFTTPAEAEEVTSTAGDATTVETSASEMIPAPVEGKKDVLIVDVISRVEEGETPRQFVRLRKLNKDEPGWAVTTDLQQKATVEYWTKKRPWGKEGGTWHSRFAVETEDLEPQAAIGTVVAEGGDKESFVRNTVRAPFNGDTPTLAHESVLGLGDDTNLFFVAELNSPINKLALNDLRLGFEFPIQVGDRFTFKPRVVQPTNGDGLEFQLWTIFK